MSETPPAIIAAAQASEATTELLRFLSEGPANEGAAFGDAEPAEKLAEALKLTIEIQLTHMPEAPWVQECREGLNQLLGACTRFIEGWA